MVVHANVSYKLIVVEDLFRQGKGKGSKLMEYGPI